MVEMMRPPELAELFAPIESLTGVGPRLSVLMGKALALPPGVATPRVVDLLWHMPTGAVDRRAEPSVAEAQPGTIVTLKVRVLRHRLAPRGNPRAPGKVVTEDDTGRLDLVFFGADPAFVARQLPEGSERYVSGRIERYLDTAQMVHPDYILPPERRADLPLLDPIYPLTAGLAGKVLGKAIRQALQAVPAMPEWLDAAFLAAKGWPDFASAVLRVHRAVDVDDVTAGGLPRQRLAYDELLARQLALGLVRLNLRAQRGRPIAGDGRIRARLTAALPFTLTGSQRAALAEIAADLAAPHRMMRLLQGDVGSGKTMVALMAMANAVECGTQAALMAPTEVLARQHAESIAGLAERAGLRLGLLTGREKGRARTQLLARLARREIDIVVGTHALFSPDVTFADLALVVVDEQHRFGVGQRMALQAKGQGTNVLAMTATPIPRTLLMTHYGDLDVSRLTEKPPGRKPIRTTMPSIGRLEDVVDGLARALAGGAQVYWVCPLIETSEVSGLAAAEARHAHLRQVLGPVVGLLHGGMKPAEKDEVMARFADGSLQVLVATTVIEVGVNVPNATVMVIEHAERFGLAQLHQLRGRVGRGDRQSYCLLLHEDPLGKTAQARLDMMTATEDGFAIAEKDLELRGGGEVLGARQSGMPEFRVADVPGFQDLLATARDDARLILTVDPALATPRGQALRLLLYLFECDEAVRLFRAA
jgi:ATP-dependent DNA helicase RecG